MTNAEREAATATALVAAAKAGDPRAFDALVARYRKRIFALALHITRSASEADDIAQDVFLKAYRALPQFEGRSQFFTWVYRMTVNRSLNSRRDRMRRGEDTLDDARLELAVAADARHTPGTVAELRQTYARLLRALDGLPVDMRTTVILVSMQGMSYGEVAVVQGVTEGTIAWRMHEARHRLHEAMLPIEGLRKPRAAKSDALSAELAKGLLDGGFLIPFLGKA
ncbi:MAG TPA: sigma-70 family RNA polymerase sigma factor [Kofleriaceae bacterium]